MVVRVCDIARASGVSRTTVLRALWDKDSISPATKARVMKVASEMKYLPNHIARTLVLGHSNFVGIAVEPSILPILHSNIGVAAKHLREAGYTILLHVMGNGPDSEKDWIEELVVNRVAGVIAIPGPGTADPELYRQLVDSGTKLVLFDKCIEELRVPQIICDYYQCARLATDHLIAHGHTNIAHLAIPQDCYIGRERARGFNDALANAGIPHECASVIETIPSEAAGEESMRRLLRLPSCPTGIVARNDTVARGAMRAVFAAGLSVPEDVSIVGNSDLPGSDMLRTSLTTIRHQSFEMFDIALRKLLDLLNGCSVPAQRTVLSVELVVRSSCSRPSQHRELVCEA